MTQNIDIQPDPISEAILLVVENVGPTAAFNVRILRDPPLESGWTPKENQPYLTRVIQQVLVRTMPMLPPHRRLTFLLDNQERFQNTELPRVYTFTVNADGPAGAAETLEYTVDLDAMAWDLWETRPTKRPEVKLTKIEQAVRALSTHGRLLPPTGTRSAQMGRQRPSSAGEE